MPTRIINSSKKLNKKLKYILSYFSVLRKASNLAAKTSIRASQDTKKKCLFYTSVALNYVHIKSELVFGEALINDGWDVAFVFCNGYYDTCEFSPVSQESSSYQGSNCKRCKKLTSSIISASPSTFLSLSDVLLDSESQNYLQRCLKTIDSLELNRLVDFEVYGIKLHEHVFSTICRQTLSSPKELTDISEPLYKRIAKNVCKSIFSSRALLSSYQPDLLVCTHGIYLNHGPIISLSKSLGISTTVWGVPYRLKSYYMTKGDTYHRALLTVSEEKWNIELTHYESSITLDYLISKESGGRDYWHYAGSQGFNTLDKINNVKNNFKNIYVAFTNVDWDAQIFYGSNLFPTQLEWIEYTIKHVAESHDKLLIIRVHPADANIFKSRDSFSNQIIKIVRRYNPPNVILVEPNDSISSYDLIKISSLCLVYGSKISLECSFRAKPTIITGNSLFKQSAFSYIPDSLEQYSLLLASPPSLLPNQVTYALRFAHYLYFRVFQDSDWAESLLDPTTPFTQLSPGKLQSLKHALLHGTA